MSHSLQWNYEQLHFSVQYNRAKRFLMFTYLKKICLGQNVFWKQLKLKLNKQKQNLRYIKNYGTVTVAFDQAVTCEWVISQ